MAGLIGFGLSSFTGSLRLEAFGLRQVAGGVLAALLGVGLLLLSVAVMAGTWGVGSPQERIPPAWTVVGGAARGPFRVLWLTGDVAGGLPPPAGDPQRRLEAGPATIRYALTDRGGASVLDIGRPFSGPGPDHLELALREILGGTSHHGGALLAPFGIRFVVAEQGALPAAARDAFDAQVDVNLVPASGFVIFRNSVALPPAATLAAEPADLEIIAAADPSTIAMWRRVPATALERVPRGWTVARPTERCSSRRSTTLMGAAGRHPRPKSRSAGDRFRAEGDPCDPSRVGSGEDPCRPADDPVARRTVGDEEARGSMSASREGSARGPALFALASVVFVVVALAWRDRAGPRVPAPLAAGEAPSGAWICPHGGGPDVSVALFLANPAWPRPTARLRSSARSGRPPALRRAGGTTCGGLAPCRGTRPRRVLRRCRRGWVSSTAREPRGAVRTRGVARDLADGSRRRREASYWSSPTRSRPAVMDVVSIRRPAARSVLRRTDLVLPPAERRLHLNQR